MIVRDRQPAWGSGIIKSVKKHIDVIRQGSAQPFCSQPVIFLHTALDLFHTIMLQMLFQPVFISLFPLLDPHLQLFLYHPYVLPCQPP